MAELRFKVRKFVWGITVLVLVLGAFPAVAQQGEAPTMAEALKGLKFRSIGPANMGGRIDDFAVVESNPSIVYVGTAGSGVWKTVNGGTTWEPIFDNEAVPTIGDIAVSQVNSAIVWVGTGEPANRQSSSWGNGVYKSTDAGKTWTHMGLANTHHIGRVLIHPRNPDIVYVAALGPLWGPNEDRGVFRTTDGGKSWEKVLYINEDTGVVDIAIDRESPNILYAGAYQRRRTAYGFNGGGPGGGVFRTTDGGDNWTRLKGGLPESGDFGRIGLDVYRGNTGIVYAIIEHKEGGVFRSEDKGETWKKMSDTNPRPMYYSQIRIDPNNDQRIWVLGARMYYSDDGGKTFVTNLVGRIHGDHHAFWINPSNSDHIILGSDGGIHWSYDRGRTWDFVNTLALGQFYEVGFDMAKPYNICGGLQDNGSWCGPSRTLYSQGITNEDWYRVGGGDGFYVKVDPTNPDIIYGESQNGNLYRREMNTTESRRIRPRPAEGEEPYRFQWNSPLLVSSHDPNTIYYAGNFLFKSTDRGDTWEKLGGDLTTGVKRDDLEIMGRKLSDREILSRNDGISFFPTATTIAESPVDANVLWVGTDDGNVQVTRDGGKNWSNVADRIPGLPKGLYISRIVASRPAAGRAFVTVDGHRSNDFGIYAFMTDNFGRNWKVITNGIPKNNGSLNVIREHPRTENLLFAGGEYGLYVSFDRGANWQPFKSNLPTAPVDDIAIHPRENDLILGTHGRAVWVLDDITPLEQISNDILNSDINLFDIRPATMWRIYGHKGSTGHKMFIAPNPPYGVFLTYYLKAKPGEKEKVKITVTDAEGREVRSFDGAKEAGINRVAWNLRANPPVPPLRDQQQQQQRRRGRFRRARGPRVEPGTYTVKVTVGEKESSTKTAVVEEDPRISISAQDRRARRDAINQLTQMVGRATRGQRRIAALRTALDQAIQSWKRPGAPAISDEIKKVAGELFKKVDEVSRKFQRPRGVPRDPSAPAPLTQSIGRLFGSLEGYTAAPLPADLEEMATLETKLAAALAEVRLLMIGELQKLNKMMNDAGVPHITAGGRRPRR